MGLIDTKDMIKTGQFKTESFCQMLWLTRFRGCRVANTLHVPRRNMLGKITTSTTWILDPDTSKPTQANR